MILLTLRQVSNQSSDQVILPNNLSSSIQVTEQPMIFCSLSYVYNMKPSSQVAKQLLVTFLQQSTFTFLSLVSQTNPPFFGFLSTLLLLISIISVTSQYDIGNNHFNNSQVVIGHSLAMQERPPFHMCNNTSTNSQLPYQLLRRHL